MMMEKILMQPKQVRFGKAVKFILPTYLTSLFNTLYTIVDGIFVSACVGTNALAAINIVYPIVNILTGIALAFATGGGAFAAISLGAGQKEKAGRQFSVCLVMTLLVSGLAAGGMALCLPQLLTFLGATPLTMADCRVYAMIWLIGVPAVVGKELCTYFIRADGSPGYGFLVAAAGRIANILLGYVLVAKWNMGVLGAGLATILGLFLSCGLGIWYFCRLRRQLRPVWRGMKIKEGIRCAVNGAAECVSQLAIAITTVVFNRTALALTGEDGIAAVSIIMYLQFLFIGLYFGYSMGIAPLLSHGYGQGNIQVCRKRERYSYRFFAVAPPLLYGLAFLSAPLAVSCFAQRGTAVWTLALEEMRLYGLGYLVAGLNIFTAIRLTSYGKGHWSAVVTLLRSVLLLIVFLLWLPKVWGMARLWLAMPLAEMITIAASVGLNQSTTRSIHKENQNVVPGDPVTE